MQKFKEGVRMSLSIIEMTLKDEYPLFMTIQMINIHRSMNNDIHIHLNFYCKTCS